VISSQSFDPISFDFVFPTKIYFTPIVASGIDAIIQPQFFFCYVGVKKAQSGEHQSTAVGGPGLFKKQQIILDHLVGDRSG
jgi:hypothetical protein